MKKVLRVLIWLAVLYGLFLIAVYLLQGLVLYPGQTSAGNTEWAGSPTPPPGYDYIQIQREGGEPPVSAFMSQTRGTRQGCLLWFHGAEENIAKIQQVLGSARRLAWHVVAIEYPGFGANPGSPSYASIMGVARGAFDGLVANGDVERDSIWTGGWSLGAVVAIELAAVRNVRGVVAFSPCTSLADALQSRFPFVPVGLLLKDRFDARTAARSMTPPLLVVHGSLDTVHPVAMAKELADLVAPRSQVRIVEGASHTDIFEKGGNAMWDDVSEFVGRGGPGKR